MLNKFVTTGGFVGGTWVFRSNANVESARINDTDSLHFGYWAHAPEDKTNSYVVNTFHGGAVLPADRTDGVAIADLVGTATYRGAAAGKYALREQQLNAKGQAEDADGAFGRFTANAMLIANFGGTVLETSGPPTAADQTFRIRGAITNFKDGDTNLGLRVNLMPATIATADGDITAGMATTASIGLNDGGEGTWNGLFHGMSKDMPTLGFPTGVSGDFNATFDSGPTRGSVVGAFGASQSGSITNKPAAQ